MTLEPRAIADKVYWVGINDRIKELFESIWPIPFGISYNSYVVIGENDVALIDTVDEEYAYEYLGRVIKVVKDLNRVKYIVINHLEPDHHGATPYILEHTKNAKLIMTSTASVVAKSLYNIPDDRIFVVKDGDSIDLGRKTLRFIYTPWLHWPETMVTYLEEDGILFSCDPFGSYGALEDGIFDDEIDLDFYLEEAKRYFSNIVAKYTKNVLDALEKLKNIRIIIIAPSHGPLYRSNVNKIVELYRKWSKPEPDKDKTVVIYASMYGRSEKVVDIIVNKLINSRIRTIVHDISITHPSYILSDIIDAYTLVLIYPSYDAGIFPYMENLLYLLQLKQLGRGRNVALINTYAWSSTSKYAVDMLQKAGFNIINPIVETKTILDSDKIASIDKIIETIITMTHS